MEGYKNKGLQFFNTILYLSQQDLELFIGHKFLVQGQMPAIVDNQSETKVDQLVHVTSPLDSKIQDSVGLYSVISFVVDQRLQ